MLTRFQEPVWIWEKPASPRAIGDVERAVEWLLFFWPDEHDRSDLHRAAKIACLEAHEGKVDVAVARAAFVAAAQEASLLTTDPRAN
jgi:hypothetical protein